ncbi:PREDICTED: uncharacterized protein LOC106116701 [Papilio xuthus]|uniref:Uncharacterized protein LOC106116701 n=1 Tax=Papilio xuthus TaxID=66420 RepID=A0AAJ6Z644_PAPXU|nr:PREDICTED: uncharacterized protein LOC106116701 [Papilio xuthus]
MTHEERLTVTLKKLVEKLEIKNYEYHFRNIQETIENYFGILIPITLKGENKNGDWLKELIVKMPPNQAILRELGVIKVLYGSEVFVYNVLIPYYRRLSKIDLNQLFPKCYYADSTLNNEVIVMKDMCKEGFQRFSGDRFLDADHIIVSLKSLAQFHGLSMILQYNVKNIGDEEIMTPYISSYPRQLMVALKDSLRNHINIFKDTDYEGFYSMILTNFDHIVDNNTYKASRLVYGHGDLWKENILFKYEDNKPISACMLDFQTTRLLCPAQDVLIFILTSAETKVRRKCYEFFLSTYYDCLQQTLSQHSLDPETTYSRSDFNRDLKTVAFYSFIASNLAFALWLGLEEKAIIQSKNICEEGTEKNSTTLYYKQIMLDIIQDFVNLGYYVPKSFE